MKFEFLRKTAPARLGYLCLLPVLPVYLVIVYVLFDGQLDGDEGRYLWFAENILNGFYSPYAPDINLWNGPGYPLLLAPFLWLGASHFQLVLLNACLHFGAVMMVYAILKKFYSVRISLIASLIWAGWFFAYAEMSQILSESYTIFLLTLFGYLITSAGGRLRWQILAGFVLGLIILTKVIFLYVLLLLMGFYAFRALVRKQISGAYATLFLTSCFTILPYVIYTYQVTGKFLYLSNAGGMSLYWMSTPHPNEFGDWNSRALDAYCWDTNVICNQPYFEKHHGSFMAKINALTPLERDAAFREQAIRNIRQHPVAFVKNTLANFLRMFFNYPESYNFPRNSTLVRMVPGAFLMCCTLISLAMCWIFIRRLPSEMMLLLLLATFYLGGSSLLSAYPRMLHVVLPILMVFFVQTFTKILKIRLAD